MRFRQSPLLKAGESITNRTKLLFDPFDPLIVPEPAAAFLEAHGFAYQMHEWMSEEFGSFLTKSKCFS
jgi:hypothetical protein